MYSDGGWVLEVFVLMTDDRITELGSARTGSQLTRLEVDVDRKADVDEGRLAGALGVALADGVGGRAAEAWSERLT